MTPVPIEDVIAMMASDDIDTAQTGMAGCQFRIAEVAPLLRSRIEAYANGAEANDDDLWIILRGLHVLAAARDTATFAPLIRILHRPNDDLEDLFGDCITENLSRIVASVFDGDGPALFQTILRPELDGFARWALMGAAAVLTHAAKIERSTMATFLGAFARLPNLDDIDWSGWMEAVGLLEFAELRPLAVRAYETGSATTDTYDIAWLDETLKAAALAPADLNRFERNHLGFIDDPIRALAWLDKEYRPKPAPVADPGRKVGRNDACPCGSGRKFKKCCIDLV